LNIGFKKRLGQNLLRLGSMKRQPAPRTTEKTTPRLVLRRETIKALDEDALHQARGGAAYGSSGALMANMEA
jgi:hypothetical protein